MRFWCLIYGLLLACAASLSTWLEPSFQAWAGSRTKSGNVIATALGESRKLFARHFYVKADAYFHAGYYPSIFDTRPDSDKLHMASATSGTPKEHEEGMDFLGEPKDWIDRFGRNFFPSVHRHLDEQSEGECEHCKHHHAPNEPCPESAGVPRADSGLERELLPWLKLAAVLDPERPETYVVASFWLRSKLGKVNEAEQFLREGLRENPGNYEILFELGRIYFDNRKDNARARTLWQLALKRYRESEAFNNGFDTLIHVEILGQLAKLEEQEKNYPAAIRYFEQLKEVSPNKTQVQAWIDYLKAK
jgi:tetratricopeptide (TPR) repeat protein